MPFHLSFLIEVTDFMNIRSDTRPQKAGTDTVDNSSKPSHDKLNFDRSA